MNKWWKCNDWLRAPYSYLHAVIKKESNSRIKYKMLNLCISYIFFQISREIDWHKFTLILHFFFASFFIFALLLVVVAVVLCSWIVCSFFPPSSSYLFFLSFDLFSYILHAFIVNLFCNSFLHFKDLFFLFVHSFAVYNDIQRICVQMFQLIYRIYYSHHLNKFLKIISVAGWIECFQ